MFNSEEGKGREGEGRWRRGEEGGGEMTALLSVNRVYTCVGRILCSIIGCSVYTRPPIEYTEP